MAKVKNLENLQIKESDLNNSEKQLNKRLIKKDIQDEIFQISLMEENNSNFPDGSDDTGSIFSR